MARAEIHFVFIHAPKGFADEVLQRLTRIELALNLQRRIMTNVDDELTTVEGALDALTADEQRELADLTAIKAQGKELSPDEQARFDAIVVKLHQGVADIDAVDPAPAAPIGDGSGDAPAAPPVDTTPVDEPVDPAPADGGDETTTDDSTDGDAAPAE